MSRPWHGQSVVIIDDSPGVRDELRQQYEALGLRVAGMAGDGFAGLSLVQKALPDLVSLDLIMPEMDGVECYRKLMQLRPEQKVVVVSWLGGEQKIIDNLKSTIPPHLIQAKPVTADLLRLRLEKVYGLAPSSAPHSSEAGARTLDADLHGLGVKIS